MTPLTPIYDGLLAEAFDRARSAEAAAARAALVAALHTGGPTGRCLGCGLPAPCPTAGLLTGAMTLEQARAAAQLPAGTRAPGGGAEAESFAEAEAEGQPLALPAMPSAADIFAPNPAFNRALSILLGGA